MKLLKGFGLVALIASTAYGQMQDNQAKQMRCNDSSDGDRARACEIREQTFPGLGRLTVDGGQNGGATVKGWLRNDVLVRSKVEAWADNDSQAHSLLGQIQVQAAGGQVSANGPSKGDDGGWSVSYEIFVPQTTDLNLKAHNGGISISDVRGHIEFDTVNGGVHLKRVAGDVSGNTKNGGLTVDLGGTTWEGRQLEAQTQNGGVTISIPESYSAHVMAETVNGGMTTDFPITLQGNIKTRQLDLNVGSGGPLIHISTHNGGVHVKKVSTSAAL